MHMHAVLNGHISLVDEPAMQAPDTGTLTRESTKLKSSKTRTQATSCNVNK